MTILLLAGIDSLVVTTFPPTDVPVIWKVCPLDVAAVVSVPAARINKEKNYACKRKKEHLQESFNSGYMHQSGFEGLYFVHEGCYHCIDHNQLSSS